MSLLELQVVDLEENVVDLDEDVDFLFDEQVIQDERLLGLENRVLDVENQVEGNYTIFRKCLCNCYMIYQKYFKTFSSLKYFVGMTSLCFFLDNMTKYSNYH